MVRDEDYTAANLYLARAVQSSPGDEKILFDHGISLLYLGQMQQARENFEQAARLNPTIDRNVIGKIYLHFKQTEWAALEFETAFQVSLELRRAPDLEALILLAESYDQLANSSEAQDVLRYVIKESPRPSPLAHAGLGLMLLGTSSRNYGAMKACGLNREVKFMTSSCIVRSFTNYESILGGYAASSIGSRDRSTACGSRAGSRGACLL